MAWGGATSEGIKTRVSRCVSCAPISRGKHNCCMFSLSVRGGPACRRSSGFLHQSVSTFIFCRLLSSVCFFPASSAFFWLVLQVQDQGAGFAAVALCIVLAVVGGVFQPGAQQPGHELLKSISDEQSRDRQWRHGGMLEAHNLLPFEKFIICCTIKLVLKCLHNRVSPLFSALANGPGTIRNVIQAICHHNSSSSPVSICPRT